MKPGREGDDRGWDGWMASLTRWTWIWVSSGSWWWTGMHDMLPSMKLQRVRHDWATELSHKVVFLHLGTIIWGWNILCCGKVFPGSSFSKESACSAGDPVWSLGREDPLEKEMANHSSILAWKNLWAESLVGCSPRVINSWHDWATNTQCIIACLLASLASTCLMPVTPLPSFVNPKCLQTCQISPGSKITPGWEPLL